jgi:DNA polymerase III subunit gamma/tau
MSAFVVSARKYRPQRFEDVVGQRHIAQTLKNALATDHVAHAFLFCGPRGVGKTTCARILAKILNCQNRTPDFEACNSCSSCTSFNDNASFNIIELDAASNNSVEHIRALIEQVRFQPQQGKYKVFIIDEVHMLSNQAFNAFLKTLEEPPPYAIFILATTEKHKIIPTILSRCQIFDFRRINVGDMVLHLQGICAKENIQAEEAALHIIGQKADGALRDALSIFDRITSAAVNRTVRYADVIEQLNVLDYDYYFQITDALLAEDLPGLLNLFDQILQKGFEPDIFMQGLAEHLRNILVCKDETTLALLEVADTLRERYRRQAALSPQAFLLTALNLCNDCDINYKMARHKRLHVEMALIKMCHISRARKTDLTAPAPAAVPEKKTTDGSIAIRQTLAEALQPYPSSVNPANGNGNGNGNSHSQPASNGNAAQLTKEQLNLLATDINLGAKKVERISFKLEAFEKAVQVDEAHKATLSSKLSHETITAAWQQYAQKSTSPTLQQAMQQAELTLSDKVLTVSVVLMVHRSLIQEEMHRLLDQFRAAMHDPALQIRLVFDEAKASALQARPAAAARPRSNREKLDALREANPALVLLMEQFDLKLEE